MPGYSSGLHWRGCIELDRGHANTHVHVFHSSLEIFLSLSSCTYTPLLYYTIRASGPTFTYRAGMECKTYMYMHLPVLLTQRGGREGGGEL